MSRICAICGKGAIAGRTVVRRGKPKKEGGVGLKTTGITNRRFLPNLQRVKAIINGARKTLRVCTNCIQAGKVKKA